MLSKELLCFQCMQRLSEPGMICPHCGHDNQIRSNDNGYLSDVVLQGQYYIGKALGRGGFGITYMAMDLYLERAVAIKEYFPATMAGRDSGSMNLITYAGCEQEYDRGCSRAMEEGRTVARIGHVPGVVQVHNVFPANNTVYIVMEYVGGMTLANLVQGFGGRMPWQVVYSLLEPLMGSLHTIHTMKIIHRDVSPDNIMIRNTDGRAVLLDFGAAHDVSDDQRSEHSVSLRIGFAPAEQYSSVGTQDGRIDEYALCATMYFALTGLKPPDATERLYAGTPLRSLRGSGISQAAEAALYKGMAIRADDRFPDMAALHHAFLQIQRPTDNMTQTVLPVVRGQTIYPQQQPLPESRSSMPASSVPGTSVADSVGYTSRIVPPEVQGQVPASVSSISDSTLQAPPEMMQAQEIESEHVPEKKSRARVIIPIAATAAAAAVAVGLFAMKPGQEDKAVPTATVLLTDAPTEEPTEIPTEIPTEVPSEVPTEAPTEVPTDVPTEAPTEVPTSTPNPMEIMAAGETVAVDGVTYRMQEDGTLEVAGYDLENESVLIPGEVWGKAVTSVGFEAFTDKLNLKSVRLEGNLTQLGDLAFAGSVNLVSAEFAGTLQDIDHGAFRDCHALERLVLPEGVLSIGEEAFYQCFALNYVSIPGSVQSIADNAFEGAGNVVLDVVPGSYGEQYAREHGFAIFGEESVPERQKISEGDFEAEVLKDGSCSVIGYTGDGGHLVIPDTIGGYTVKAIGNGQPLCEAELMSVTIPAGVEEIGENAFGNQPAMMWVSLPDGLRRIGAGVFTGCGAMIDIYLPDTLEAVGDEAFAGCGGLVELYVPRNITEIGQRAFDCGENTTLLVEQGSAADTYARENGRQVAYVTQEANVDTGAIGLEFWDGDWGVRVYASGECDIVNYRGSESDLVIPETIQGRPVIGLDNDSLLCMEHITSVILPEGMLYLGSTALADNVNLRSVQFPSTMQYIGGAALMGNRSLTELVLPEGLRTIAGQAFAHCENLTYIYIPSGVQYIGSGAFDGCGQLQIHCEPGSCAEQYALDNGIPLYQAPFESMQLEENGFAARTTEDGGCVLTAWTGSAEEFDVPAYIQGVPVTALGEGCFKDNTTLCSVLLPISVTEIGSEAFAGCSSLGSVNVLAGSMMIRSGAFAGCSALEIINLPEDAGVEEGVFDDCPNLVIDVPAGSEIDMQLQDMSYQTGWYAWQETDGGCVITGYRGAMVKLRIPSMHGGVPVKAIGKEAFMQNESVRQVYIPQGVTTIGEGAFDGCINLNKAALPESLQVIEKRAFRSTAIERLYLPDSIRRIMPSALNVTPHLTLYVTSDSQGHKHAQSSQLDHVVVDEEGRSNPEEFTYGEDENGAYITGYTGGGMKVYIPSSYNDKRVYAIEDSAFLGQLHLREVYAGANLKAVQGQAFAGCSSLEKLVLPESAGMASDALLGCDQVQLGGSDETQASGLSTRFRAEFDENGCIITGAQDVGEVLVIPETVDGIRVYAVADYAFSGSETLREVILSEGVESIGVNAFANCRNLQKVQLPQSLMYIASGAFGNCTELMQANLPDGLQRVVTGAFKNCGKLTLALNEGTVGHSYAKVQGIAFDTAADAQ